MDVQQLQHANFTNRPQKLHKADSASNEVVVSGKHMGKCMFSVFKRARWFKVIECGNLVPFVARLQYGQFRSV